MKEQPRDILSILKKSKRIAFIPQTEEKQAAYTTESKFGGLPYLNKESDWCICSGCNRPMSLFVQLNLEETPIKYANNKGLLQVFYCTTLTCNLANENYVPFNAGVVVRRLEVNTEQCAILTQLPDGLMIFPENRINKWSKVEDYPHPESYHTLDIIWNETTNDILEDFEPAIEGDKIGGYPAFVQGHQIVFDPEDNTPYTFLMQIDSQDNLPFMFGDMGRAYVCYHPQKPDKLALFWQSY